MTVKNYIQMSGKEIDMNEIVNMAKKEWKERGLLVNSIKTIDNYVVPERGKAYVVFNKTTTIEENL